MKEDQLEMFSDYSFNDKKMVLFCYVGVLHYVSMKGGNIAKTVLKDFPLEKRLENTSCWITSAESIP